MMRTIKRFCLLVFLLGTAGAALGQSGFVSQRQGRFVLNGSEYRYIGTNYWYGAYLPLVRDSARGIQRLRAELDFLKSLGLTNLRVLAGAEGTGRINGNYRVGPPLQPSNGVFDTSVLYGLDVLLDEMHKRQMKAVVFLSNNWEWSGGFLQYLNWNGLLSDSALRAKMEWEDMRDHISRFYTCSPCKAGYLDQLRRVLGRTNTVNQRKYTEDPTIMSWQLANEPRPMRPAANRAYAAWIAEVAAYIKSVDRRHLVSIGHEGEIGTQDLGLYETIHADPNIDYLTIHIWPKNWGWMTADSMRQHFSRVKALTRSYIATHLALAARLGKPLVIEEFGFPRDDMKFDPGTPTRLRDKYYNLVFGYLAGGRGKASRSIGGMNFWAFNGQARPVEGRRFWQPGDDYMGDPPMEEQSLYGVFDGDSSTLRLIRKHAAALHR